MRFFPEGPVIPDELLEERDLGNVVFFCGAGVSLSAGMPTFEGLCRHVVDKVGAAPNSQPRRMLQLLSDTKIELSGKPPIDQIFNLLQEEYGSDEVDFQVARRLKPRNDPCLDAHETILRLSKLAEGRHQIATTNFDHLFEKAGDRRLSYSVAPALPDLAGGQRLPDLVYLHGRFHGNKRRGTGRHGLVVSSSDFGRAYLAEGWATRFVRDLLDRYTVVLLGYSASDPPMRYLLQGLHTGRQVRRQRIYAFDAGTVDDVQGRWSDSGITPLAYPESQGHSALWSTLKAWAERADDPPKWRRDIVTLASKGPRALTPEQRGQVASILRTVNGAKLFAEAEPSPPAEWLCVLDAGVRYATPELHAEYRFDDDPPRRADSFDWKDPASVEEGDDLLTRLVGEVDPYPQAGLAGAREQPRSHLSSRLLSIAGWIANVMHEPVVAWWAAKSSTLHPRLISNIERRLGHAPGDLSNQARKCWFLLLESIRSVATDESDALWYELIDRIKEEGWTPSVSRLFVRATIPRLVATTAYGSSNRLHELDWSATDNRHPVQFKVSFPAYQEVNELEIPNDVIPRTLAILRGHLERAAGMLIDTNCRYWHTKSLYREERPSGGFHGHEESSYLFWFRSMLDRMSESNPRLVRHDYALWPKEERFFFNKLRLYLWANPRVLEGETVGYDLLQMSDEGFWDSDHRRELLMMLKARWSHLQPDQRGCIESRIADGRPISQHEDGDEYRRERSIESACMLGWLLLQGCPLTDETRERLERLRKADTRWNLRWDEQAALGTESWGGSVRFDTDPTCLLGLPLDAVIPVAMTNTRDPVGELVRYRPFNGLIKVRPVRAVAALTHASRGGEYPEQFWSSVLQLWPEKASRRLTRLFAERLARLPSDLVLKIRSELFMWARKHLRDIAQIDLMAALRILDQLLEKLFANSATATDSRLEIMPIRGSKIQRSRRTTDYAINSPVGEAAELLLGLLEDAKHDKGKGILEPIRSRLEKLAGSPGEGRDHAVCIIAQHADWLNWIDPDWFSRVVLPWMNLDHDLSEPAWNGLAHYEKPLTSELFSRIKSHFLSAIVHLPYWQWDESDLQAIHNMLMRACLRYQRKDNGLSFQEAKLFLQDTDDSGRLHCLQFLTSLIMEDCGHWRRFVKPFLENAWPRERRFRTESTTEQFARMALWADDLFPQVVDGVIPNFTAVSGPPPLMYSFRQGHEESLPSRFPEHALRLMDALVPDDPGYLPYDLEEVLSMIVEADPSLRRDPSWKRLSDIVLRT